MSFLERSSSHSLREKYILSLSLALLQKINNAPLIVERSRSDSAIEDKPLIDSLKSINWR